MPESRKKLAKNAVMTLFLFMTFIVGLFLINFLKQHLSLEDHPVVFGATFSKPYAESMGLDWKKTYLATLDDLGVRRFRIPAYWDNIEPSPGKFHYEDVDWQVTEAHARKAKIILAIGRKLPRWPECHVPVWTQGMNENDVRTHIITMLKNTVKQYVKNDTIVAWQIENEPTLNFGICPPLSREFLKQEVSVVRSLDSTRPIIITESGELSTWIDAIGIADVVGVSTYRSVWFKYFGYFYWPFGPNYYIDRYKAISSFVEGVIITELQAEPWGTQPLISIDVTRQRTLMNPERLLDNTEFARKIGFPEVYFWGVEWWYWNLQHGRPDMWETGKKIIQKTSGAPGFLK